MNENQMLGFELLAEMLRDAALFEPENDHIFFDLVNIRDNFPKVLSGRSLEIRHELKTVLNVVRDPMALAEKRSMFKSMERGFQRPRRNFALHTRVCLALLGTDEQQGGILPGAI